jgi:hypothetical protein
MKNVNLNYHDQGRPLDRLYARLDSCHPVARSTPNGPATIHQGEDHHINHFVRDCVARKVFVIKKVDSASNLADGFTKPLVGSAFAIFASLVTRVV